MSSDSATTRPFLVSPTEPIVGIPCIAAAYTQVALRVSGISALPHCRRLDIADPTSLKYESLRYHTVAEPVEEKSAHA